jgi:hypothetical protein
MTRKTVLILVGATLLSVMAGVAFAVMQQTAQKPVSSSLQTPSPTATVSVQPPKSPAATPSILPISPEKTRTSTVREVKSCKVTMAIVNDPEPPINVRSSPTTEKANVVGQLQNGTFLTVEKEQEGWFQISNPKPGWVAKSRTTSSCNEKVERVRLGTGETSITITDRFIGTGSHRYLFAINSGQRLTVTSNDGPFPVIVSPRGNYLTGNPDENRRQWSEVMTEPGEHTLMLDSNFKGYPYSFVVEIQTPP